MVLLDTGTPGTSRLIDSEDDNGETLNCDRVITNPMLYPLSYTAQFATAGRDLSLSSWCIASLYIHNFSIAIDFSSEEDSGSTGHRNS